MPRDFLAQWRDSMPSIAQLHRSSLHMMGFTGKPQKKSIKDFFKSSPATSQDSSQSASLQKEYLGSHNASTKEPFESIEIAKRELSIPTETTSSSSPPPAVSARSIRTRANDCDTQPPIASQASANSGGSKRVVAKGELMVLNSDSDNESIESLDWGEPKKVLKATNMVSRSKRTTSDYGEDELRRPQKQMKSGKKSLTKVVETAQRNMELEQRIKEHKADLEKLLPMPASRGIAINEQTVGQVVEESDEESGKAQRLLQAMQRTKATQTDSFFHFFVESTDSMPQRSVFPIGSLPNHRWIANFQQSSSRDQSFLTGFARHVFRLHELPEELASWLLDELCYGEDELLSRSYLHILESYPVYLRNLLDQNKLDSVFTTIGARMELLDLNAELAVSVSASQKATCLPGTLKAVVQLLQSAAPKLHTKARTRVLHILFFVCLDSRVFADSDLLSVIQDVVEAIICNFVDNHSLTTGLSEVISKLLPQISNPILQRNLVNALPSQSPLTSYMRRYLALSMLVYPTPIDVPLADPIIPKIIHEYLDTSIHFKFGKGMDYSFLAARLELLDIAIGPGPLSVPYQPLVSPTVSDSESSPITAPFPAASEVKDFNREVDALAQHVKYLGNSIVEAGAVTDLTILEAKDYIERLCARLEHAVRIGGKKVHNPFSTDEEATQLKVSKFLKARNNPSTPKPILSIFGDGDRASPNQ